MNRLLMLFVPVALLGPLTACVFVSAGAATGAVVGATLDVRARARGADVGSAVAIQFTVPRAVTVVDAPTGTILRVPRVAMLKGVVAALNADTLVLTVSQIDGATGRKSLGRQQQVTVAVDSSVHVRVNRRRSLTAGLVAGTLIGLLIGVIVAVSDMGDL